MERLIGRQASAAPFKQGVPPYASHQVPLSIPVPAEESFEDSAAPAFRPFDISMHGRRIPVDPNSLADVFAEDFGDIETHLALHRFAWLPLMANVLPDQVSGLWSHWSAAFGNPGDSWAWHPYTAAERAINLIDYGHRADWSAPGFDRAMTVHANEISRRLEYFGEHNTSNHLANNGRGLYRIGTAFELEGAIDLGFDILVHEAKRIVGPGGTLREGSSHYHLLYLRNYMDAYLAARRHGHQNHTAAFREILSRMLPAARSLTMPGRFPLIGDISPDCPPSFLECLTEGDDGWIASLSDQDRKDLQDMQQFCGGSSHAHLDGWHRYDIGDWSGLWHAPSAGWTQMPGHGHQDMGSAEIHHRSVPLFVDPGRGAYGETGDAALYRSATVHGSLTIDGKDPYPPNKPYYSDSFRDRIAGGAECGRNGDTVELRHQGYERIGVTDVARQWRFTDSGFVLSDSVLGTGTHDVTRSLVTPFPVTVDDDGARIASPHGVYAVTTGSEGPRPKLQETIIWSAYGEGSPGTRIAFKDRAPLPWRGQIAVEEIS